MKFYRAKNKYGAKPTNGFPSKLESMVHDFLLLKQKQGEIKDIKRQQTVVLQDGPQDMRITWRVDFSFVDKNTDQTIFVEAKGIETSDYKLKLKMWRKLKPYVLEIYKASGKGIYLAERIDL